MKKMLAGLLLIVLIAVLLPVTSPADSKIPLPEDMNIILPDPSLPENLRDLPRKWEGKWDYYGIPSILIFEEIDGKKARLVYAVGDTVGPGWSLKGNWQRIEEAKVTFSDGEVTITWQSSEGKFIFYYKKNKPNILEGLRTNIKGTLKITMKRVSILE